MHCYCPPLVRFIDRLRGIVLNRSRSSFTSPPTAPAATPSPPTAPFSPVVLLSPALSLSSPSRLSLSPPPPPPPPPPAPPPSPASPPAAAVPACCCVCVCCCCASSSSATGTVMALLSFPPLLHTPSLILQYRNILMAMFSPSAFSSPSKPGLLLTSHILYVFCSTHRATQSSSTPQHQRQAAGCDYNSGALCAGCLSCSDSEVR